MNTPREELADRLADLIRDEYTDRETGRVDYARAFGSISARLEIVADTEKLREMVERMEGERS